MLSELRTAIENGGIRLHYQPQLNLKNRRGNDRRSVVRWHHPMYGDVSPGEFVALAEVTDLIHPLTYWAIRAALADVVQWNKRGVELRVAINVSARVLQDTEFPGRMKRLLQEAAVQPEQFELEITESAMLVDPERAKLIVKELHGLGVLIAIDDYGTGFSSLGYLRDLRVHSLKVDKSFVVDLETREQNRVIVESTAQMAHALGLQVVAEGVETKWVESYLRSIGYDLGQGYLFARPMPADDVCSWVQRLDREPQRLAADRADRRPHRRNRTGAPAVPLSFAQCRAPPRPSSKTRSTCRCGSRPTGSHRTPSACGATATLGGASRSAIASSACAAGGCTRRRTPAAVRARDSSGSARSSRSRMAAVGGVTGVAVALAAFAYDGSQPVNVVRLLALLVGVQLVLLALTLVLLPGRVPGLRRIQDLVAALNPGAWAAGVFRKLAHASPDVTRLFDRHAAHAAYRRFAKWQLLYWAQTAAVAFNVAALVAAVMLVTFSDLAFGWSTTLDANPELVTRVVQTIAWPWHALAPGAVPSAALIEQSQFFRLDVSSVAASVAAGARRVVAVHRRCAHDVWPHAAARIARASRRHACARRPWRCCSRTAK